MKPKRKSPRRVQPENWAAILSYGQALKRFAKSHDSDEFTEFHITHESMANALIAIAMGDDARNIFGQDKGRPGRTSEQLINRTRAYVYWAARIVDAKSHNEAVRAAQQHFSDLRSPSAKAIDNLATRYQREALARYEEDEKYKDGAARVRSEIKQRSRTGKW